MTKSGISMPVRSCGPRGEVYHDPEDLVRQLDRLSPLGLSAFQFPDTSAAWNLPSTMPSLHGEEQGKRIAGLIHQGEEGRELLVLCDTRGARRSGSPLSSMKPLKRRSSPRARAVPEFMVGELGAGFSIPDLNNPFRCRPGNLRPRPSASRRPPAKRSFSPLSRSSICVRTNSSSISTTASRALRRSQDDRARGQEQRVF